MAIHLWFLIHSDYNEDAGMSMFRSYLKVAFRSMFRNKGFTAINIFGLAIGMACSLLIFWSKVSRGWPGPYLGQ
jgi:hypothetical protein